MVQTWFEEAVVVTLSISISSSDLNQPFLFLVVRWQSIGWVMLVRVKTVKSMAVRFGKHKLTTNPKSSKPNRFEAKTNRLCRGAYLGQEINAREGAVRERICAGEEEAAWRTGCHGNVRVRVRVGLLYTMRMA
ncbi:hypothetical protein L2E82_19046 [Cichorium intybus]|uniref:Uncharacterized protein n=1 Tax=Cichorium intybus TaxID=13427 RepID=A0ACB9FAQ7_CICIN|nr:hypothetical protein L2E82_19046 [Cichorium intybus]